MLFYGSKNGWLLSWTLANTVAVAILSYACEELPSIMNYYLHPGSKIAETLNSRCDGDEGVLCHDNVSVGPAKDRDRLADLPRALGTLPLQGPGHLPLGRGGVGGG